jgi:hypothetical protein
MVPLVATRPGGPSPAVPDAFSDPYNPTEISPSIFDGATEIAPPPIQDPELAIEQPVTATGQPSKIVSVMDWLEDVAMDKRKRAIAYAIAGGAVLLLVIVMIAKCGGGNHAVAPLPDAQTQTPTIEPDAAMTAVSDAAIAEVEVPADATPPTPPPVDAGVTEVAHPHVAPVIPHVNADAQFQRAFQAFVKGDAKAALALLKINRAQNPNHAASWRLLGQVYKKLGDHDMAKASFKRYLALSPNASDAAAIKKELE